MSAYDEQSCAQWTSQKKFETFPPDKDITDVDVNAWNHLKSSFKVSLQRKWLNQAAVDAMSTTNIPLHNINYP